MEEKLMVTLPLKDYTDLVAAKATAEAEKTHLFTKCYDLNSKIEKLEAKIESMKGDGLK